MTKEKAIDSKKTMNSKEMDTKKTKMSVEVSKAMENLPEPIIGGSTDLTMNDLIVYKKSKKNSDNSKNHDKNCKINSKNQFSVLDEENQTKINESGKNSVLSDQKATSTKKWSEQTDDETNTEMSPIEKQQKYINELQEEVIDAEKKSKMLQHKLAVAKIDLHAMIQKAALDNDSKNDCVSGPWKNCNHCNDKGCGKGYVNGGGYGNDKGCGKGYVNGCGYGNDKGCDKCYINGGEYGNDKGCGKGNDKGCGKGYVNGCGYGNDKGCGKYHVNGGGNDKDCSKGNSNGYKSNSKDNDKSGIIRVANVAINTDKNIVTIAKALEISTNNIEMCDDKHHGKVFWITIEATKIWYSKPMKDANGKDKIRLFVNGLNTGAPGVITHLNIDWEKNKVTKLFINKDFDPIIVILIPENGTFPPYPGKKE